MNRLDGKDINPSSFAFRDLLGQDAWVPFTPSFTSLTVVGDTSYIGRYRLIGRKCEFQVKFSAATSIASTAGTTYLTLPVTARGLSGMAAMTNDSAKTAVGTCHVDSSNSRCYLPTQAASANTFNLAGSYEI
jgi:hypothetical protein